MSHVRFAHRSCFSPDYPRPTTHHPPSCRLSVFPPFPRSPPDNLVALTSLHQPRCAPVRLIACRPTKGEGDRTGEEEKERRRTKGKGQGLSMRRPVGALRFRWRPLATLRGPLAALGAGSSGPFLASEPGVVPFPVPRSPFPVPHSLFPFPFPPFPFPFSPTRRS